jgi:two-component system cell cycle sensor histidine kinase PleC
LAASGLRQHRPFNGPFSTGRGDHKRGPLLLVAALLTAAGVAVPHIDPDSLSTLLFVAGAGLASALIALSWHQAREAGTPPAAAPDRSRPSPAAAQTIGARQVPDQARFSELVARPRSNPTIDRAAWAKLTAHMSHELRTPLNAVLGFSEMMSNEVFGPLGSSCYSAYARDIHASGRLLLKSAEDALAITALLTSADRKGAPAVSCLRSATDEATAFALPDLGLRSIAISADIDPDVDVVGDPQATRQMLINLISEAQRSARGGAILGLSAVASAESIRLSIAVSGADMISDAEADGFPMILARTLCDLSGARLATADTADGGREWTVDFLPVAQNDLFLGRVH